MKLAPEKRDRPVVADVGTAAAAAAAAMVAEIAASAEISKIASIHFRRRGREFGQGWIRTTEGVKPADLQSAPFGRFGTYPDFPFTQPFALRDLNPERRDSRAMGASYVEPRLQGVQADFAAICASYSTVTLFARLRGLST